MDTDVTANPSSIEELDEKIQRAFTAKNNMKGFTGWEWGAYKVEAHEKDIVIEALQFFEDALKQQKQRLLVDQLPKEETNDNTAVCE